MKKMLLAAVSLTALVAGGIPAAFADPRTTVTLVDNVVVLDACTGEDVHFTGSTTMSVAFSANNNTFHMSEHVIIRDDGVGLTTGASYKANGEANIETNGSFGGFPFEHNAVTNTQVIGEGAVANEGVKE